jgi:hypothetical protein
MRAVFDTNVLVRCTKNAGTCRRRYVLPRNR